MGFNLEDIPRQVTDIEKKKQKIREGIAELYWLEYRDGCQYPEYWEEDWPTLVSQENDELGQRYMDACRDFANQVLRLEDSQGAVIKVKKELNGNLVNKLYDAVLLSDSKECKRQVEWALREAGWHPTERLLKE